MKTKIANEIIQNSNVPLITDIGRLSSPKSTDIVELVWGGGVDGNTTFTVISPVNGWVTVNWTHVDGTSMCGLMCCSIISKFISPNGGYGCVFVPVKKGETIWVYPVNLLASSIQFFGCTLKTGDLKL